MDPNSNRPQLDELHLRFFVELCRRGSLTVSAQKMGLSTSAASRLLAHLRELFGEQLFRRTSDGLVPTARAVSLLPKFERLLLCYEDLFRPQVFNPNVVRRRIRIACSDNAACDILGRVIPLILERAPELEFDIIPIADNIVPRLRSGEIDFGIFPTEKTSAGVRSALIYESCYRYVVRRGHPLEALYAVERKLTPEDLAHYRFLDAMIPPGAGIELPSVAENRHANIPGRTQIRTAYILSEPLILARTDLVGMLPESITRQYQYAGLPIVSLCKVFGHSPHRPHLLWHERSDEDPVTAWIRALFVHAFKGEPHAPFWKERPEEALGAIDGI